MSLKGVLANARKFTEGTGVRLLPGVSHNMVPHTAPVTEGAGAIFTLITAIFQPSCVSKSKFIDLAK